MDQRYYELYQALGALMEDVPEVPHKGHPDYHKIVALNEAYVATLDAAATLAAGDDDDWDEEN